MPSLFSKSPFERVAEEWRQLPKAIKENWKEKGKSHRHTGYTQFKLYKMKQEEEKTVDIRESQYLKGLTCFECGNKTIMRLGNDFGVCDVCGEIKQF